MTKKTLLITRPFYENPTNYLYFWSKPLIDLASRKNFTVIDLEKEKVNRKELEGRLKKVNPELVVFNGHGNEDIIFGQDNEPLIINGDNESLLSGKIVYSRSCQSAKILGVECIKKGTRAYIGYKEDFIFMFDESKITRPLQDETAKLFLEPSNQVVISLIKGNTAIRSYQNGKKAYLRNIQRLLTSESPPEDTAAVRYLIWNMIHQVCLGDQSASM